MTSTSSGLQSTFDWGRYKTSTRRDDALPMTSTGEGTSYVTDDSRLDDESNVDPPREPSPDGAEVTLFSEPGVLTSSPLHNVYLSVDDALEFLDLLHRRRDRTSWLLDLGELEVGKEFSSKDSFLGALKQHNIMSRVNHYVVKSKFEKFKAKCSVQDGTYSWKIMASVRKKTGVSQDHPKMD
ncbi:hypothetical protein J1N35_005651 [Gossypium stocksii]|uniref:Transposase MuDR plant domain-containing protein n=1 Tax=Gossypium stocksii TaxID=47602 RepID=A0A9D3WFD2_9ROSI|nr:hypothetical protein J1N35_005651 [Gossypium stocksii]